MLNLKNEKGSIVIIVIFSCMFFIASVVCIQQYMKNKQISVDRQYKQIKANYEVNVDKMNEIYSNLVEEENLDVTFSNVNHSKASKKIAVDVLINMQDINIKTLKYGWLYKENTILEPNSQEIVDWIFVENSNSILAKKTYTEQTGYYYLCIVVNDKEFWMTSYINID